MADNPILTNQKTTFDADTNDDIQPRTINKSLNVQTQVVVPDFGGAGAEQLSLISALLSTLVRYAGNMAAGTVAAGYANLLTPGAVIRGWRIDNFTDGDVVYSLNGGTTDHGTIAPGKSASENYASFLLTSTDMIHVKQGTKVPANGTVYAIAYGA